MQPRDRSIALHEAGHAVVAAIDGTEIRSAELATLDEEVRTGIGGQVSVHARPCEYLGMLIGGPVASALAGDSWADVLSTGSQDAASVRAIYRSYPAERLGELPDVGAEVERVAALLRSHWNLVECVADGLEAERWLSGDGVLGYVRTAIASPWIHGERSASSRLRESLASRWSGQPPPSRPEFPVEIADWGPLVSALR